MGALLLGIMPGGQRGDNGGGTLSLEILPVNLVKRGSTRGKTLPNNPCLGSDSRFSWPGNILKLGPLQSRRDRKTRRSIVILVMVVMLNHVATMLKT